MHPLYRCLIAACLAALLAACATPTVTPAAPVTITFFKRGYTSDGTDTTSLTNAQAVQAFEKDHPNIKVNLVGIPWTADGTAQLEAALAAHSGINVFSVNMVDLARYARAGLMAPIDPYLTTEDKQDFYASGLQAAVVDGKVYAWPLWVTAVSIYANPAIFKARGVALPTLDDPWTWDEFVTAAQQLTFTRPDGIPVYGFTAPSNPGTMAYQPLFYIDGGRVLSPDGKRFVQNSAEGVSAMQKVGDLANRHHVTPLDFGQTDQAIVRSQFISGTVAMLMETPGFIPDLEKRPFDFVSVAVPLGKLGKTVSTGAFGLYGIANVSDTLQLQAANEFARYLTGSQVARDVPNYQQAPGLRRSNTSYATSPNRDIVAKLVSFGIYEPVIDISPGVRLQWETALQSVLLGQKTARQALDEIAPIYQAELDRVNP